MNRSLVRKADKDNKATGLFIALAVTAIVFILTITFIYPVNFSRLGGKHNWLNGSTIKFVNEWLEEGAGELNFTMYEYPYEIEREGMGREPYVSYPNGTIVTVWALAKITGRDHIGISFLKTVACTFYCLDALMFAAFSYLLLTAFKFDNKYLRSLTAAACASCWILQPVNVYYLGNIFFADQYVTFWIMAFILVEFIDLTDPKPVSKIVKSLIIYCGCMVDYYFWIMTAIAWGLDLVALIIKKSKFTKYLAGFGLYAGPSLLAVLSYYLQISHVDNWFELLTGRFMLRVSNEGETGVSKSGLAGVLKFFKLAYCDDSRKRAVLVALFILITVILVLYYIIREKKLKDVFTDGRLRIILLGTAAPAAQILVLRNHSGIHEFSLIKVSWPVIICCVVLGMLAVWLLGAGSDSQIRLKGIRHLNITSGFVAVSAALAVFMLVSGHPVSAGSYKKARDFDIDYSLEYIMYDNLDKDDVCFSFTREIACNGPQRISITGKLIYRIGEADEICTLFPDLPQKARKILIIDSDLTEDGSKIVDLETQIMSQPGSKIIYYDDRYIFVEVGG